MLSKLAALLALRQSASANSWLFRQLLAEVGTVLCLSLTIAFLASLFIIGLVYLAFHLLMEQGLDMHTAMITLGIFLILLMVVMCLVTAYAIRRIKDISKQIVMVENPLIAKANHLIDAFLAGFQSKRSR